MRFDWVSLSNPVAIWWLFLLLVSASNIALWLTLRRRFRRESAAPGRGILAIELMLLLCAAYVFGCAFRSVLPRADVQRICLFDTWLSSVVVGRSVATVAEVCFAAQWAIVLRHLATAARSDLVQRLSGWIVPLILTAECCSWYAVITTSYLGNTVENSIWAVTFLIIAIALVRLLNDYRGIARYGIGLGIAGITLYLAFLVVIDVPMYFTRWQADLASGKQLLGIVSGLHDVSTRWVVTHDLAEWRDEIAWMALYFSTAVWSSLVLCGVHLARHRLRHYVLNGQTANARRRAIGVRAGVEGSA
jgi:hypothetical protein